MNVNLLKIVFLIAVVAIHVNKLSAQTNFTPGYVITNSNDTIRGYIMQANVNAYTKCSFKTSLNGKITDYSPGDIKAYRLEDKGTYFVTRKIQGLNETKILFFEYLIQGKANIFFMRDNVDHYYIETDQTKMMELTEKELKIEKVDGRTYVKPASYFGKLKFALSNCPEIYPQIDKVKLEPRGLINLARNYHIKVCTNEQCVIFESKLKPIKIHLEFVAGVSFNSLGFDKVYTDYRPGSILGCKLEFENLFFNSEQSIFTVGVLLNKFYSYTFYTNNYSIRYNEKYITAEKVEGVDINTYALKIPLVYNYMFSLGKIRPYLGVGLNNIFLVSQNKRLDINYFKREYTDPSFPVWNTGLIGNAGIKSMLKNNHQISLELNYEYTRSLIANPLFGLHQSIFSLQAGYAL